MKTVDAADMLAPPEVPDSIGLFENVSDIYDPTRHWLDGLRPVHPDFSRDAQIQDILTSIKGTLLDKILTGCLQLVEEIKNQSINRYSILINSMRKNSNLWLAVVSAQKYGVIYLCSRSEARSVYRTLVHEQQYEARLVNNFLSENFAAVRAINYGVHSYIHHSAIQMTLAKRFIPPRAIAALGKCSFATKAHTPFHPFGHEESFWIPGKECTYAYSPYCVQFFK